MEAAHDRSAEFARFLFEDTRDLKIDEIRAATKERFPGISEAEYNRGYDIAQEMLGASLAESRAAVDNLKAYGQARYARAYQHNVRERVDQVVALLGVSTSTPRDAPTFLAHVREEVPGVTWPEVAQAAEIQSGIIWMGRNAHS